MKQKQRVQARPKSPKVDVDLQCPYCGLVTRMRVPQHFRHMKCPACRGEIHLWFSTGVRGELDEEGYYYKAYNPMRFKGEVDVYAEMFGVV